MKLFSKQEWLAVIIILGAIAIASFFNFRISLMRARDGQRLADLQAVVDALNRYNDDFGFFPASSINGEIVACAKPGAILSKGMKLADFLVTLAPCAWGSGSLADITDASYPAYLTILPKDPRSNEGRAYFYISNSKRFQLYTSLETKDSAEFRSDIVKRNLSCGRVICSAGRGNGTTPLDKSLEEYEQELLPKN